MFREFNEWQWAMLRLDAALTNSDPESINSMVRNQRPTPIAWLDTRDSWYLSDGGYSRVHFGEASGRLFLTSNSTDRVKARWNDERVQDLVDYASRLIREALQAEGQRT